MKQAIVILLKKNEEIEKIRKKYIRDYKKFKPHITIAYPFEIGNEKGLNEHIKRVISKVKPFKLSLYGLKKSAKEYYLYFLIDRGKDKIINLYQKLNKGILSTFKNKDMPKYIPHITLGVFETKSLIDNAIKELRKEKIKFETTIDSIQLLTLKKDNSIKSIKKFKLR